MTADDRLLARIEDAGFAMLLLREYREALLAMPTLPETAERSRLWREIAERLLCEEDAR